MGAAEEGDAPQEESVVDLTPQSEEEPPEDGPGVRWLGPLLVVGVPVALAAGVFAALYYLLFAAPEFPETDSRACPGSVEPLGTATARLGLTLPRDARDLHYLTSPAGSGEALLKVSFRVPAVEADVTLAANGLTRQTVPDPDRAAMAPPCAPADSGAVVSWTGTLPGSSYGAAAAVTTTPAGRLAQVQLSVG